MSREPSRAERKRVQKRLDRENLGAAEEMLILRDELENALSLPRKKRRVPRTKPRRPRKGSFRRHFVIPDTQVRAGVRTNHLAAAGRYIRAHASPDDLLIHLGDHFDHSSLSYHDSASTKVHEGRDYAEDLEICNEAMADLDREINRKRALREMERHFFKGNHEDRQDRWLEEFPWFRGLIGDHLYALDGWHVHPFKEPVDLDGILYAHYFYAQGTGRAYGGSATNILGKVGQSFVQGHRQILDVATKTLPTGLRQRGVIAGAFYQHDEPYRGPQGDHWRGMLVLNEVQAGDFDLMEISLDYLLRRWT